jgi:hypothetical protein
MTRARPPCGAEARTEAGVAGSALSIQKEAGHEFRGVQRRASWQHGVCTVCDVTVLFRVRKVWSVLPSTDPPTDDHGGHRAAALPNGPPHTAHRDPAAAAAGRLHTYTHQDFVCE